MAVRYTDSIHTREGNRDFVVRRRKPTIVQLAVLFLATLVLAVCIMVNDMDKTTAVSLLCVLLGGAGWYVILHTQRNRDLVLATEFQNALFASAIGFNNKFCIIIRREGNIVYMDNAFQSLFPDILKEKHLSIDGLLQHGKVAIADKEKVFKAIERGVYDKAIFDIRGSDDRVHRIVMSVEPIPRPNGFILLRCREFVEQRTADTSVSATPVNPLLSKSSITLFSYIMDKMNMGVYMIDPAGNIIYANPTLEQWLMFQEGEVTAGSFSLKDIVYMGSQQPGPIAPTDFEGNVTLQKKAGGLMRAFVNQKIISGDDGKTLGCVALIHNVVETDNEGKKTLW